MISRWPTITFSTSLRSALKPATNSWTRASWVIDPSPLRVRGQDPESPDVCSAPILSSEARARAKRRGSRSPNPPSEPSKVAQTQEKRSPLRDRGQTPVDFEVTFDLLFRRIERGNPGPPRRAQSGAQGRIAEEALGGGLQPDVVAEEQAGDVVLDQRAVALDVGGDDRSPRDQRFQNGVGHAPFGDRTVQYDVDLGEQRAHLGMRHGTHMTCPRLTGERPEQSLAFACVKNRSCIKQPQLRSACHQPAQGSERQQRALDRTDTPGEKKEG